MTRSSRFAPFHAPTRRARASAPALLAAAGLAIVFAGVVGYFAFTGKRAPSPAGASPTDLPPPDIRVINSGQNASGGNLVGILSGGSGFFMQVADKDDPSRVAAEITADTSEPIEGSRYRMEQPRAWIFLDDGRTVAIQAAKGQARIPNQRNSRPEEGTLEGDVVIRLFDAKADGARPDVEKDRAVVVARTARIQFDATTGELIANDKLTIEGDQVDFAGSGMTLVFSEAAQRVELLRIAKSERLVIKPGRTGAKRRDTTPKPSPAPAPANAGSPAAPAVPAEPAPQPVETLYALVARDNVHVVYGGRDATADLLEGWTRLIDNKLPEGALGAVRAATAASTNAPTSAPTNAPTNVAANGPTSAAVANASDDSNAALDATGAIAAASPAPNAATGATAGVAQGADGEPITITWSGPLEVRPVASAEMLERDHLAIALSSPNSDGVVVTDEASGARAMGSRVAYATTTREVSITGRDSTDPDNIGRWAVVASGNGGQVRAPHMQFSLASGVAQLAGPGWICPDATVLPDQVAQAIQSAAADPFAQAGIELPDASVPATIQWSRDAEFTFATDRDNQITGVLKRVLMTGDVLARDDKGSLKADAVTASFLESTSHGGPTNAAEGATASTPGGGALDAAALANPITASTSSRLAHIQAVGNAQINDASDGGISARQLDIAFNPTTEETTPASIDAQGSARAWRDETSLRAGSISATLSRNDEDDLIATNLVAQSSVEFDNGTVTARCDKLVSDPVAQTAELTGYATRITSGTSTVAGSTMHLDGAARTLQVVGAGTFAHADPASADGSPVRTANASWTTSMKFDDAKGVLDCLGDTTATMSQGLISRDHLWADRVVARFDRTTAAPATSSDPLAPVPAVTDSDRTLTIVEAFGSEGGNGPNGEPIAPAPARFEFRRYAADATTIAPNPPLERLAYLEAPYLIANNAMGTIDANGAGRLLLVDRTSAVAGEAEPTTPVAQDAAHASNGPRRTAVIDSPLESGAFRGDALFNWTESLSLDRREGTAVMRGSTRLVHRDPTGGTFAQIEGDMLTARVQEQDASGALTLDTPFNGQFMSAVVEGSAWLRHNSREMVADVMSYDASTRVVDAVAKPGHMVTLMTPGEATPASAQRITWDLIKDRIDVKRLTR